MINNDKNKKNNLGITRSSDAADDVQKTSSSEYNGPSPQKKRSTFAFVGIVAALLIAGAVSFLFSASASDMDEMYVKRYKMSELVANPYNVLAIPATPAMSAEEFSMIFEMYKDKDSSEIIGIMEATPELNLISFGFYYLANTYAMAGENNNALKYHEIAAHQYLNPQSLLKLSEWHFFKTQDYTKAYEYLHQSLEVTVEITANNRSHPIAENGKDKAQYLLAELDRMGDIGAFDKAAIREKLKAELPSLLGTYRKMYGLPIDAVTLEAQPL